MKIRLEAVNKNDCSGRWKIVYLKGSALHTHPASEDPSIHPGHRRRDMQRLVSSDLSTQTLISSQTAVGIAPAAVVATIRHAHPETSILAKDVANHKRVDRREALASNTPTELLLKQLSTNKFFFKYKVNPETSRLQYLFWSHPGIKQFYKWNSDVLIMDCTYKTNAYDLPLLNIIAMTNMNTVLPIAQCWLTGEKEDDFLWALEQLQCMMTEYAISKPTIIITDRDQACMNALDRSFPDVPSLVCRWHMNRNVLAKTRTLFGQVEIENPAPGQDKYENTVATDQFMELYYDAVESPSEAEFESLCATIREFSVEMADYLDKHWWKYKSKLVHCWTSQYLHFGYRDTSAVESTHAKCKRWLESARGDLLTAFDKLLPWWKNCIKNVSYGVERDVSTVSHELQEEQYTGVVLFISRYELQETSELWKIGHRIVRKQEPIKACTGGFRGSNGRPCVHDLIEIVKSERQRNMKTEDFHEHWLTRRGRTENCASRVLDPAPLKPNRPTKRRKTHKKNHGLSGTARDPTFADRVDMNNPAPRSDPERTFTKYLVTNTSPLHTLPTSTMQLPSENEVLNQRSNISAQEQIPDSQGQTTDTTNQPFYYEFLPPRDWGRAGRRPF